jgi:hypothetical protein
MITVDMSGMWSPIERVKVLAGNQHAGLDLGAPAFMI